MKSMTKEGLQQVFEIARQRYGAHDLQCDLVLDLCERGLMGGLKGRDYLIVRMEGRECRCDISPTNEAMSALTLGDLMFKANIATIITYDPKAVMKKALDSVVVRTELDQWVPQAEATVIRKVLRMLLAAAVASTAGLNDGPIVKYLKSYDTALDGISGKTEDVVTQLMAEMPAVEPAYRPSGKTTFLAVMMMMLGCLVGVAAGAIVGLVVHTIGVIFSALVGGVASLVASLIGWDWLIPVAIYLVVALVFLIVFMAMGMVIGEIIAGMGTRRKNRNRLIPAILAVPSAIGAAALFCAVFLVIRPHVANWAERWIDVYKWPKSVVIGICAAGALVAAICAVKRALEVFSERKFCEQCQLYMDDVPMEEKTLDIAKEIVEALRSGNLRSVSASIKRGDSGQGATVKLAKCPECGKGYIDLTVKHEGRSWLAGSTALKADETSRLAALKEA